MVEWNDCWLVTQQDFLKSPQLAFDLIDVNFSSGLVLNQYICQGPFSAQLTRHQ